MNEWHHETLHQMTCTGPWSLERFGFIQCRERAPGQPCLHQGRRRSCQRWGIRCAICARARGRGRYPSRFGLQSLSESIFEKLPAPSQRPFGAFDCVLVVHRPVTRLALPQEDRLSSSRSPLTWPPSGCTNLPHCCCP